MEYLSVAKTAEKWGVSQRSVRNYCSDGRILGAFLTSKIWNIPNAILCKIGVINCASWAARSR